MRSFDQQLSDYEAACASGGAALSPLAQLGCGAMNVASAAANRIAAIPKNEMVQGALGMANPYVLAAATAGALADAGFGLAGDVVGLAGGLPLQQAKAVGDAAQIVGNVAQTGQNLLGHADEVLETWSKNLGGADPLANLQNAASKVLDADQYKNLEDSARWVGTEQGLPILEDVLPEPTITIPDSLGDGIRAVDDEIVHDTTFDDWA